MEGGGRRNGNNGGLNMATSEMNLYQRRIQAKQEVYKHEFEKISGKGLVYKYIPIETIKPIVEKAWNEAGIIINLKGMIYDHVIPPTEKKTINPDGSTSTATWTHMAGVITFEMVNADNPADKVEIVAVGEAKDNSDKVINKIYTSAIKNLYKTEFNITEGAKDDTDAIQTDDMLESKSTKKQGSIKPDFPPATKSKEIKIPTYDPFFKNSKVPASKEGDNRARMSNACVGSDNCDMDGFPPDAWV